MKLINTVLLLVLGCSVNAQVIVKGEEWVKIKNGEKKVVIISKMDDAHLYIIQPDDPEKKVSKIPRTVVEEFHAQELWTIPFNYNDDKRIEYSEVIQVEKASKNDLFNAARLWFADTFKSSDKVLELDDRESGTLVGRGWMTVDNGGLATRQLWTSIKIQCKEGRYKYTIYDIEQHYRAGNSMVSQDLENARLAKSPKIGGNEKRFKASIIEALQSLCDGIKESVKVSASEDDNW